MTPTISAGSGHIGTIAIKDLKGDGQSFPGCYKTDADLRTIGTTVAAVSTFGLRIAVGAPLEVGGGYIVEEKVEGCAEELTIPFLKMPAQFILVGEEGIQSAVKPVIIYFIPRHTYKIVERCLVIP